MWHDHSFSQRNMKKKERTVRVGVAGNREVGNIRGIHKIGAGD